jgi:NAD(P)-dependent dehydrogenase (short-subunit alcohol dehydrogenase family)
VGVTDQGLVGEVVRSPSALLNGADMTSRTALITGGTSGIGLATAALLHRYGYQVAVTGSTPGSVSSARAQLPDGVVVLQADVRSLPDTDRVIAEIRERFETLDVLFLNAGMVRGMPIGAYDEATVDDLLAVNFKGQFFTLRKAVPVLNDGASIIVTVGIGITRGVSAGSAAAAGKGALLALVPALALKLAPRRIRINAVSPSAAASPQLSGPSWNPATPCTTARSAGPASTSTATRSPTSTIALSTGRGRAAAGAAESSLAPRQFLPGHDERAIHDRISEQWGSTMGFIRWSCRAGNPT